MSAEPKAAYDDLNVRTIAIVGLVGAILVFVAIVAIQVVYFRFEKAQLVGKVLGTTLSSTGELAKQRERLGVAGPGADPDKGEKSVPIATAMQGVLAEYQARQSERLRRSDKPEKPAAKKPEAKKPEAMAPAPEKPAAPGKPAAAKPATEQAKPDEKQPLKKKPAAAKPDPAAAKPKAAATESESADAKSQPASDERPVEATKPSDAETTKE